MAQKDEQENMGENVGRVNGYGGASEGVSEVASEAVSRVENEVNTGVVSEPSEATEVASVAQGEMTGDAARITEAEARAMLIEDNARAKEASKKASSRGKKVLAVVIILAVVLVVAGVAASVILGGMRKPDGDGSGNSDKQEGNDGDSVVVENPDELPDGLLATNDPLVQGLYGRFEISPLQGFYEDELSTEMFGDNREHGRLEMALNRAENWTSVAVRAKYREMFGEGIELTEEKYGATTQGAQLIAAGKSFVVYDEGMDEFRELGPSTAVVGRYIRRLERAEKDDDRIYLYERVLALKCQLNFGVDEEGNSADKEASCGVLTVAATCGTPEFGWSGDEERMTDEEVLNEAAERGFGVVRWVFEKNAEGNYVFKGLERVIEGEEGEEIVETIEEREQKIKEANA